MEEIWKAITNYPSYEISNLGNVKSLKRIVNRVNGNYITEEKTLKPKNSTNGYLRICLSTNNKQKYFGIHRLVAEAFIPNPDNLPCVNHKDENKQNNCVDNLEWCTYSYNNTYLNRAKKIGEKRSKRIIVFNTCGEKYGEFSNSYEAEQKLGISRRTIIRCCHGEKQHYKNYIFKYESEVVE